MANREAVEQLNMTREELIRLRNTCTQGEWVPVWTKQLHSLCTFALDALSAPAARQPEQDELDQARKDANHAAAIGMGTIIVRCGVYESLSPYLKAKYDELSAINLRNHPETLKLNEAIRSAEKVFADARQPDAAIKSSDSNISNNSFDTPDAQINAAAEQERSPAQADVSVSGSVALGAPVLADAPRPSQTQHVAEILAAHLQAADTWSRFESPSLSRDDWNVILAALVSPPAAVQPIMCINCWHTFDYLVTPPAAVGELEQVGWAKLGTYAGKRYIQGAHRVDQHQNDYYNHAVYIRASVPGEPKEKT